MTLRLRSASPYLLPSPHHPRCTITANIRPVSPRGTGWSHVSAAINVPQCITRLSNKNQSTLTPYLHGSMFHGQARAHPQSIAAFLYRERHLTHVLAECSLGLRLI